MKRRGPAQSFGQLLSREALAVERHNPDFRALAEAFGIAFHSVSSPEALAPRLADALRSNEPTLIEIKVPRGSGMSPWEFINPQPAG